MAIGKIRFQGFLFLILLGLILLSVWLATRQSARNAEMMHAAKAASEAQQERVAELTDVNAISMVETSTTDMDGNIHTYMVPRIKGLHPAELAVDAPQPAREQLVAMGINAAEWRIHSQGVAQSGEPRIINDAVLIYVAGLDENGTPVVDYVDLDGVGDKSYGAMAGQFASDLATLEGNERLGAPNPDMETQISGLIYRLQSPVPYDIYSLYCRDSKCMFRLQLGEIPEDLPQSGAELIGGIMQDVSYALEKTCAATHRADRQQNVYFTVNCRD
ncbi:hypothetical protein KJI95_07515 [Shewanella sp. JM162201]|uniref:Uncharacterized protein n=1 Tax=Shewanella jiangmenensis TaxID=2837387 RepID=A0ABS5V5Q5_9GAMM|nr:hypothetical protein [Shewanella jiangmenensis]MBT1444373.1 hypothetical protein [Shewanella jiangmenensis]